MAIKLNVGVSRKVGQPNYGSLGACCNIDIELDQQTLGEDPQGLHRRVQQAFAVCRQAVEAELSQSVGQAAANNSSPQASRSHSSTTGAGKPSAPRAATPAQVKAIHAIAGRFGIGLAGQLQQFGVDSPSQLTLAQASQLIDQLKQSPVPASV